MIAIFYIVNIKYSNRSNRYKWAFFVFDSATVLNSEKILISSLPKDDTEPSTFGAIKKTTMILTQIQQVFNGSINKN